MLYIFDIMYVFLDYINQMQKQLVENNYTYKEQDPQYMGEQFDRQLALGPTESRRCRDFLCLLLYLGFSAGGIVIAIVAFKTGAPHLLAAPFDSTGKQCGYSPGYQNFPYVYFNQANLAQFVCINQCPNPSLSSTSQCIYNNITSNCTSYGNYPTTRVVGICYPSSSTISSLINLGIGFFEKGMSDLNKTWPIILSVLFIAFILSIIMLLFIRSCGACLIITVIILYFIIIIGFGFLSFFTAKDKIEFPGLNQITDKQLLRIIAYICWITAGISFLFFLCVCRKLRIAIIMLRTTAEFTREECQTIFVPFAMFVTISLFFAWWMVVSIYVFSSGSITQCHGSPYACIDWNVGVKRCLTYYFIGLFWNSEVAIGMCQFVIASTSSLWYFSQLNGKSINSPVCRSFCRALTYHLGSIAFGALILCLLLILQLFFEVLHHFGKQSTISPNEVVNACSRCCINYTRCCLACFERFIRFITKNAFIMMAITGEGFCTSAHQAFYLIMRSSAQFSVTHGVGHMLMFFVKLLVTVVSSVIGYLMITYISYFSDNIFQTFLPTLIFVVISYVVSSLFMDVFGIGSDTLLLCYCLQLDILKDVKSCPTNLKSILDEHRI